MKLRIQKQDAIEAGHYIDNRNCLLSTALKRRFKTLDVFVIPGRAIVNGKTYYFSWEEEAKIHGAYEKMDGIRGHFDEFVDLRTFKPFTITLDTNREAVR